MNDEEVFKLIDEPIHTAETYAQKEADRIETYARVTVGDLERAKSAIMAHLWAAATLAGYAAFAAGLIIGHYAWR